MGVTASVNLTISFPTDAELDRRIMDGENLAAERLLALSIPHTPLGITGDLRGSGAVEPAADPETGSAVTFDTPYAARLHEHPEYNFSEPGTGGKWLENTALESKDELGDIIAEKVSDG